MIGTYAQSFLTLAALWFAPVGIAFAFAWATNHAPDWSARWYAVGQTGLCAGGIGSASSAAFPFLADGNGLAIPALVAGVWGAGGVLVAPWALLLIGAPASSALSRRGGGAVAYALAGGAAAGLAGLVALGFSGVPGLVVLLSAGAFGALLALAFHRFETGGD